MSGLRRGQALGLALGIVLIYFLFFSGSDSTDFRKTTEASLSRRRGVLRGDLSDQDLTAQTNRELQMILDKQQNVFDAGPVHGADNKPHPYTSTISFDDEVSIGGRRTMLKEKPKYPVESSAANALGSKGEEVAFNGNKVDKARDEGEDRAREELQGILKKSPSTFSLLITFFWSIILTLDLRAVIIFSKSYCPYSKRAKALLLETYTISPAPYVVELDLMTTPVPKPHHGDGDGDGDDDNPAPTLGRKLQDLLAILTGRRTVPNIMINAQSLGGSDDIAKMHADGTLEEKILKMGGKRIVSVEKNHREHD